MAKSNDFIKMQESLKVEERQTGQIVLSYDGSYGIDISNMTPEEKKNIRSFAKLNDSANHQDPLMRNNILRKYKSLMIRKENLLSNFNKEMDIINKELESEIEAIHSKGLNVDGSSRLLYPNAK